MTLLGRLELPSLKPVGTFLRLGADYSFSWWVILLFALPSYSTNLFYDSERLGGSFVEWIPVALIAYGASVIAFVIAKFIKFVWAPKAGIVYALGIYLLIGWVRGLVSYFMALYLGLGAESDLLFRLVSPPVFTLICMSVSAAVVTTISLQQEALEQLAKERSVLKSAITNFRRMHEGLQSELMGRVNGIITPAISELRAKLDEATRKHELDPALKVLQVTVDDVIRPLSHEIANEELSLALDTTGPIRVVRTGLLPARIRIDLLPAWGAILSVAAEMAPQAVTRNAVDAMMVATLVGFTLFVSLKVLEGFFGGREYSPVPAFFAFVGSYFVAGLAAPLYWMRTPWHLHVTERLTFVLIVTIIGIALFVVEMANSYRRQSIRDLELVNEDMALLTSQLRQQVWLDRKRVAMVLHGSVQGALYSAAIRLSRDSQPTPEAVASVQKDITDALGQLAGAKTEEFDFEDVLDNITALWEDSIDFKIHLEPGALSTLNRNHDSAECAIEVLREAINNSVKHGAAESVKIDIAQDDRGLIRLSVENDGKPLPKDSEQGYGSSLLDELTHRWRLQNFGGGVQLQAEIVA
jgi:signal transduction histidine kinase